MNVVVLRGTIHPDPTERTLASGQVVWNWELKVEGMHGAQKVPVQWDEPSLAVSNLVAGDEVVVVGSVRRRFFTAGGATVSRTEVLGYKVAKTSRKAAVVKLLEQAHSSIE